MKKKREICQITCITVPSTWA